MATTEQTHLILNPKVRIERTRRRLAKLRVEGLVDRITLPILGGCGCGSPPKTACRSPRARRNAAATGHGCFTVITGIMGDGGVHREEGFLDWQHIPR
ncbi:hypothetical protein ACFY0A_18490 [Streptomyces sp. NPDC001698]|uniref:hypothetical protein n=1 Tax=unclassified Streptomyces TaxID=2593676 RepID=UPI0036AFAEA1